MVIMCNKRGHQFNINLSNELIKIIRSKLNIEKRN